MSAIEKTLSDYMNSSGSLWIEEKRLFEIMKKRKISSSELTSSLFLKSVVKRKVGTSAYYSLPFYSKLEWSAAKNSIRILNEYKGSTISDEKIETYIDEAEKATGITLHEQQREAVRGGIKHGLFIITGGPGTGKTCVLKLLVYVLTHLYFGIDIRFTAPTGKAARRITESTGRKAKTIQKEIAITETKRKPNKFSGNVLIVDEVSMMDMKTTAALLYAIKNGQKLILVGDIEQLPSVGPGAILRDFLLSEVIPHTRLTKTFRQANESNLYQNIQKIKNNEYPLTEGDDFQIQEVKDNPIEQILNLYFQEKEKYGVENIALLLPYRKKGDLCSNNLNNIIQSKVNPYNGKPYISSYLDDGRDVVYTIGDPVMQLENRNECANGDIGMVVDIIDNHLIVDYSGEMVSYSPKQLPKQLALAYSMSINKSQGSEYKSVVVCVTKAHQAMLKRNLVYTAITRAKQRCVLLQEEDAMIKALNEDGAYERLTFFADDLYLLANQ